MIPALKNVKLTCGAKPLRDKGHVYGPGEIIPDAASWANIQMHLRRGSVIASPPVDWRMVHPSLAPVEDADKDGEKARKEEKLLERREARAKAPSSEALEKLAFIDESTHEKRIRRLMSEAGLPVDDKASKKELLKQVDEALSK